MGRKKKKEKVHTVTATLKSFDLSKAGSGLTLQTFSKEGKLGELIIGHGSITWKKGNCKPIKLSWTSFAKFMEQS